jgi:capsule polysaccharide export protein KpsE/RkpR
MTGPDQNPFDLTFLRSRQAQWRIAIATLAFASAGLLYGLLGTRWYRSALTVVPAAAQKSSGIASMLGGELGSLAAGLGVSAGGGADVARIAAVLQSSVVSDAVIDKFDLRSRYGAKYQENAREALWKHCEVRTLPKPGLVQLGCEDKDPRFAQALVSYIADFGNQSFRRVSTGSASEEVRFLDRRVAELRGEADEAAARVRDFQEKHQIIDLEGQAKAVVSSVAMLNAQRIAKQMELEYARGFSSPDEAGTKQLASQLSVVDEQLRELESPRESSNLSKGRGDRPAGAGMFPAALAVPKLRSEYEKLYRDRKVSEATLLFALDRLEGAKAAQARDVSTFVVLDPATLPTRKSRPGILDSGLSGAALGLVLGVALEWWRRRRRGTNPVAPPGQGANAL